MVLLVGIFLQQVNAVSSFGIHRTAGTTTTPASSTLRNSLTVSKPATTTRQLRAYLAAADSEAARQPGSGEERVNLPGLSKAISKVEFQPAQKLLRKAWLLSGETPNQLFYKMFRLRTIGGGDTEQLTSWLLATSAYNKKNVAKALPDEKIFDMLQDRMNEPGMLKFLKEIKQSHVPDLEQLGGKLDLLAARTPADVLKTLGPGRIKYNSPKLMEWLGFANKYRWRKNIDVEVSDASIHALLSTRMAGDQQAAFYHSLTLLPVRNVDGPLLWKNEELVRRGEALQGLLFTDWFNKGLEPKSFDNLLGKLIEKNEKLEGIRKANLKDWNWHALEKARRARLNGRYYHA